MAFGAKFKGHVYVITRKEGEPNTRLMYMHVHEKDACGTDTQPASYQLLENSEHTD